MSKVGQIETVLSKFKFESFQELLTSLPKKIVHSVSSVYCQISYSKIPSTVQTSEMKTFLQAPNKNSVLSARPELQPIHQLPSQEALA